MMASERTTRRDGSFVVRVWWEPGADELRRWRGWVQHVRNGEQVSFQSMADLIGFIERETGMQAPTEDAARGLG